MLSKTYMPSPTIRVISLGPGIMHANRYVCLFVYPLVMTCTSDIKKEWTGHYNIYGSHKISIIDKIQSRKYKTLRCTRLKILYIGKTDIL